MVMLYLGSVRAYAGKNMVALGLGRKLLEDGYSLSVTKPYGANPVKVDGQLTDADAWMINQALGLGQTPAQCCPVVRTQDLIAQVLRGQCDDLMLRAKEHCQRMSEGKDLLLVVGAGTLRSGALVGLSGYNFILTLGAKAVIVEPYENEFFLDDLLSAAFRLGPKLAGVIINNLDLEMNAALQEQVAPFLANAGISMLGRLPKDELLASVSVQELSEKLAAKPVCCLDLMDRLVKRFLIGAMQVGHAQSFFSGRHDFACIVGGDRPDMQLAAIEGGAACLILTGNFYPGDIIMSKAEEHKVPILVARGDTFSVALTLDALRSHGSLDNPLKIQRAVELVAEGVDFEALYKTVGLK